eukprot:11299-Heterococcus_DN1.PRE.1
MHAPPTALRHDLWCSYSDLVPFLPAHRLSFAPYRQQTWRDNFKKQQMRRHSNLSLITVACDMPALADLAAGS